METFVALQVAEAPEHPVLPSASRYDVRELRFMWSMSEDTATLDLEVSTHEEYIKLRFSGVEALYVPCGDLISAIRLRIQDTSQCPSGNHHIPPVRVGGLEEGYNLRFWAHKVERL